MFYWNKTYRWAIIILLLCHTAAVAQHYKKIPKQINTPGFIDFDSSGTYKQVENNKYRWSSFYAKSNGDPWFYYNGFEGEIRYAHNNEVIENGNTKRGGYNTILQLTDSTYLVYHYSGNKSSDRDTGFVVEARQQLKVIHSSIPLGTKGQDVFTVGRISKYKYLLVTTNDVIQNENLKFYLHVVDKDGFRLTDSISFDSTFFKQPIQWSLAGSRRYTFGGSVVINNNSSKIYLNVGGIGRYFKFPINKSFLHARGMFEVSVTTSGKVSSSLRELYYKENYEYDLQKDVVQKVLFGARAISSDNKILYCSETNRASLVNYDSVRVFRLDLDANIQYSIRSILNKNVEVFIAKGPFGQMFETIDYRDGSDIEEGRVIYNANVKSSKVLSSNITPINQNDFGYWNNIAIYDYMKLYHTIDYDCGATVRFQNKTDQSAGMDSFTWHFTREDGSMDTMTGFEPTVNYTKSGDYFYKVLGLSQEEREYGEWFIDTLKIRIPEKPVAAFTATDSVVCAFSQAEFINQSTTDTIHPTNGEKWVWTFGDGETKTVSLPFGEGQGGAIPPPSTTHVYKAPGTYSVSLFYSNGFCDSTLTKNQYITVVDAPAPGFSIDNNRGCSPFTVNVTDTVTHNTVKKEIFYGDGTRDSFFAASLPPWGRAGVGAVPHEYTQPGNYWLVQRLYGYTGCVTQLDSVRIYVTPGFTEFDTSHITNATYQDVPAQPTVPEIVTVNWPCLLEEAPVSYHLYRNNQKIAELDPQPCIYGQIVYLDSLEDASNSLLTYTVVVIDSCGTATQVGREGQPVRVSGEVVGNNELSIITYTAYQDWNVGESELSYELQAENKLGGWETINDQTGTEPYNDKQFLDITKDGIQLEKCYRVLAKGTNQASISNILCLPYTPVIFLPTAFSPNGDNLNDVYRPIAFGIEQYQMKIYNRYGEKIAESTEQDGGWQAKDAPLGAYMVLLRAKGADNEWYTLKQTVTVVR